MTVDAAYCDLATYKLIVTKTTSGDDGTVPDDLLAVSRYLDYKLDQFFTIDTAAVARVIYPRGYNQGDPEAENPWRGVRGGRILDLPAPLAALPTSVIIDSNRQGNFTGYTALAQPDVSGLTGGDYQMWPLNADKGPEPRPWRQLYIPTWSAQFGWPSGCPVQITAKWGWPAIPRAIQRATAQLTGILRLESPRATSRIPEGIDGAIMTSSAGQDIIRELQRAYTRNRVFA